MKNNLFIAIWFVAFGIADFIVAPGSSGVGFGIGTPPDSIGDAPLYFVPLFLVPTALVLEVIAMRQLLALKSILNDYEAKLMKNGNTEDLEIRMKDDGKTETV